jgi:hypothetical protein
MLSAKKTHEAVLTFPVLPTPLRVSEKEGAEDGTKTNYE